MTNADRIRAMTDEDLAYIVICQLGQCPDCLTCKETSCLKFKCTLEWLKQEVEE